MSNSGRIAPRDFPAYFLHPRFNEQLTKEEFLAISTSRLEEFAGRCPGHVKTITHFDGSGVQRRYIVEVVLDKGSQYIEAPCTYLPSMAMDLLDGHFVLDAEEWILVQQLKLKPRRLTYMFGNDDRQETGEYIRRALAPHAGDQFQDVAPEFEDDNFKSNSVQNNMKKKWWAFWK